MARGLLAERFTPAPIPPRVVVALTVLFGVFTVARGVDWALADTTALSPVLTAAWVPLHWSGLGLLAGGVALLGALASRRHLLVWAGHLHLAFVYAGITAAGLPIAVEMGAGYSALVAPACAACWHYALSRLHGLRPADRATTHRSGGEACGTTA